MLEVSKPTAEVVRVPTSPCPGVSVPAGRSKCIGCTTTAGTPCGTYPSPVGPAGSAGASACWPASLAAGPSSSWTPLIAPGAVWLKAVARASVALSRDKVPIDRDPQLLSASAGTR